MARILLLLVAFLGAAGAQESKFDTWIEKLSSGDPEEQQTARRVLLNAGTPALPGIARAQEAAGDKDARERLAAVAKEILEREPYGLQFSCGMPKMRLTVDLVNGDEFRYSVRVRNRGTETVVLHPYLSLRILDAAGNELKPVRRLGRHGLRAEGCLLEPVGFVTVAPGEAWSFTDGIQRYMHDADLIQGWKITQPGTYTLEFTYRFDRAAFEQRCRCGAEAHVAEHKPWNRALELTHSFTAEMTVN